MRNSREACSLQIVSDFLRIFAYAFERSFRVQLSRLYAANQVCHIMLRYATLNVCVRTSRRPARTACAFFARQKARWTYSKGNPAKYRNDVREKIQSEKQVHARRI